VTALTLPLLPLLTGHVNDVLLGQSRACPGRAIVTVGTGDGVVVENACMLYQVPVAHKIDTSIATEIVLLALVTRHLRHCYPTLSSGPKIVHILHIHFVVLTRLHHN
jgi:hypothetical protein